MKTAAITLSVSGACVANRIAHGLPETDLYVHEACAWSGTAVRFATLAEITATLFTQYRRLVYVAPCGAVVRTIAPHIRHKLEDPAIVVVDVGARFAVSLLSGHEGGANDLAITVANVLGAEPIVTTTSDAVKDLIVGIGCRRGTPADRIVAAVRAVLGMIPLAARETPAPPLDTPPHNSEATALDRVRLLASADVKRHEPGLFAAGHELGVPVLLVPSCDIREARRSFAHSELAQRKVNLPAVAEPAALLAGRRTRLLVPKTVIEGVTVAIAKEDLSWSASAQAGLSTEPDVQSKPLQEAPS